MKKKEPQKRVNVVSLQLIKESSLLYGPGRITSMRLAYELFEPYLKEKGWEHLYVVELNTKKESTFFNLTSIGTINQAIAVPRDILKPEILYKSSNIIIVHCHLSRNTTSDIVFTENSGKIL